MAFPFLYAAHMLMLLVGGEISQKMYRHGEKQFKMW